MTVNGMPQLDWLTYPSQVFWSILFFFIVYTVVSFGAKRIESVIGKRDTYRGGLKESVSRLKDELENLVDSTSQHSIEINNEILKIEDKMRKNLLSYKLEAQQISDRKLQDRIAEMHFKIKNDRDSIINNVVEFTDSLTTIYFTALSIPHEDSTLNKLKEKSREACIHKLNEVL